MFGRKVKLALIFERMGACQRQMFIKGTLRVRIEIILDNLQLRDSGIVCVD